MQAADYEGDLTEFLRQYQYLPDLTKRLDKLSGDFSDPVINEIVLWKVNRFVSIPSDLLASLNGAKFLSPGEHKKARQALLGLLKVRGVDLPMASTFLRFRNPKVFQIIDRHAYRAVYGADYSPSTKTDRKADEYFKYLDDLRKLCEEKRLEFETVDRLLYSFDKKQNRKLGDRRGRPRPRGNSGSR